jgi:hypothetical protein
MIPAGTQDCIDILTRFFDWLKKFCANFHKRIALNPEAPPRVNTINTGQTLVSSQIQQLFVCKLQATSRLSVTASQGACMYGWAFMPNCYQCCCTQSLELIAVPICRTYLLHLFAALSCGNPLRDHSALPRCYAPLRASATHCVLVYQAVQL